MSATTRNFVFNTGGTTNNGNKSLIINSNNTLALSNDTAVVGPATFSNTVTALQNAYMMRSLGVGTSNPMENVDIIGNTRVTGTFMTVGACVIRKATGDVNTSNIFNFYGVNGLSNDSSNIYITASNTVFIGASNTIATFKNTRMGIMNSNPAYTVDVTGDINFTGSLYKNGAIFSGGAGGSSSQWSNSNNFVYILGSNVGIGLSNPSYPLHVSGDIYSSANITSFSDCNFKTNINRIENTLSKLDKVSGYTYTRTDISDETVYTGLLAQEIEQILPEVICKDHNGYLSISYGHMAGFFVETLKALKQELKEVRDELNNMRQLILPMSILASTSLPPAPTPSPE